MRRRAVPGLVLCVGAKTKTWFALYYVSGGKPRYKKLGKFPVLSVKQARAKARVFLADPQKALKEAAAGTVKEIAENFIKRHVGETRDRPELRSRREIERCLNAYVYPHWGNRPFHDLQRDDVTDLLDKIEDRHGASQADRVLAILRKLMNWHRTRVSNYTSPIVPGMNRVKAADRERERILSDDEIRAVWKAADHLGYFGAIVRVALLTGQRREKIATMKWSDLAGEEWCIHTEPREKGNPGWLLLPPVVLDILAKQPRLDDNPYVFPGSRKGQRRRSGEQPSPESPHFNAWSQRKAELEAKLPATMPHWTIHDLRRTARSLMSRAGVHPDIAERVLGHSLKGVRRTYDRHSYRDEKAEALRRLAGQIDRILNRSENVVPFRAAAE